MSITIIKKGSDYLDYILDGIAEETRIIEVETKESSFWRLMHLLSNGKSRYPKRFLSSYIAGETILQIKSINTDSVVLLGAIDSRLAYVIGQLVPKGVKKHIWVWNEIGASNQDEVKSDKRSSDAIGLQTSVYNPVDADTYGFPYVHQVYRQSESAADCNLEVDCFWLGRPKGRQKIVMDLKASLEMAGISCDFRFVEKKEDYLTYSQYLKTINHARCLVDINNPGNQGLSLRVMEALFLKKKLITNNPFVKKCDFYNADNIYVLGEDNDLESFMRRSLVSVPQTIIDKYEINNWLHLFDKQA